MNDNDRIISTFAETYKTDKVTHNLNNGESETSNEEHGYSEQILNSQKWEDRVSIVRKHFERKGYRVHSGLQFGCELVLYADDPSNVHSDFCVHVVPEDGRIDWRIMQTLVRSMPDFHKTLILAHVRQLSDDKVNKANITPSDRDRIVISHASKLYFVDELAMATEHAPFRHKKASDRKEVGTQLKKKHRFDNFEVEIRTTSNP